MLATSFAYEQASGRHVPRLEPDLVEPVEPPRGDIRDIERRRTRAPDVFCLLEQRARHAELRFEMRALAKRKSRPEQRSFEAFALADANAPVVHERAVAL